MSENVEVVRRLYDAVARRDREAVLSLYDPDVEWDFTRSRWTEVMSGQEVVLKGQDALKQFFRRYYEIWAELEDELVELVEVGEQVISVIDSRARGRVSGVEVGWYGHAALWTVRRGRIVRVVWFASIDDARAAARA